MVLTCCLLSQASPRVIFNPFLTPASTSITLQNSTRFAPHIPHRPERRRAGSPEPRHHRPVRRPTPKALESKTGKILLAVLLQQRRERTIPSERRKKGLEGNSPTVTLQSRLEDSVAGL